MVTAYKVGDKLYECAHRMVAGKRRPCVRTWHILSVVPDPEWEGPDGQPQQAVMLRANVDRDPRYMAACAEELDSRVTHGVWRRTKRETLRR